MRGVSGKAEMSLAGMPGDPAFILLHAADSSTVSAKR